MARVIGQSKEVRIVRVIDSGIASIVMEKSDGEDATGATRWKTVVTAAAKIEHAGSDADKPDHALLRLFSDMVPMDHIEEKSR